MDDATDPPAAEPDIDPNEIDPAEIDPAEIDPTEVKPTGEHHHRNISGGTARAAVFGVSDGLVSNVSLILGVAGADSSQGLVRVAGLAGLIAGAVSMAAGEYLATQSQEEVFDREIELEREHIAHFRDQEVEQMRGFLTEIGVADEDLDSTLEGLTRDDATLLNAMKVFEFAIVDSERRSPLFAMLMSGLLFLIGAMPTMAPFFFDVSPSVGLVWAAGLTSVGLFAVGVLKTSVTDTNPWLSGLQNLAIAGVGGVIAYGIGLVFDATLA